MSALVPSIYQNNDNYVSKTANFCKETLMPENPSWKLGLLKSTVGVAGICYSNIYNGSFLDMVGELLCSGLFFSGINDLGTIAYSSLAKRVTKKNQRTKKPKHTKLKDFDRIATKLKKTIKLTAYIGMSLHCLYNYESIGKLDSLTATPFTPIDEAPNSLIQGFQISVCALSILMNLLEMTRIKEENFLLDHPVAEIVNSVVMLSFFAHTTSISSPKIDYTQFHKTDLIKGIDGMMSNIKLKQHTQLDKTSFLNELDVAISNLQKANEDIAHLIAIHGGQSLNNIEILKFYYARRTVRNAFGLSSLQNFYNLLCKNVTSYKLKNSRFKKIESTAPVNHPHVIKPQNPYRKKVEAPKNSIESPAIEYPFFYENISHKEQNTPQKKVKVKTKGIADKHKKNLTPPKNKLTVTPPTSLTTDPRKVKREKALERLAKLRELHPVKEVVIEKEIKKAMKFAQAHKESVKGGYSLNWETDKGLHSLNYEEPHGVDSTNYAGNKLDRVLNVLFTIYISDLDEKQATKYINKYNPSLFNLKFINYLFFNRS